MWTNQHNNMLVIGRVQHEKKKITLEIYFKLHRWTKYQQCFKHISILIYHIIIKLYQYLTPNALPVRVTQSVAMKSHDNGDSYDDVITQLYYNTTSTARLIKENIGRKIDRMSFNYLLIKWRLVCRGHFSVVRSSPPPPSCLFTLRVSV